jgi:hypothetical protein
MRHTQATFLIAAMEYSQQMSDAAFSQARIMLVGPLAIKARFGCGAALL